MSPVSHHFPDSFFRVSVKALIRNGDSILLQHEPAPKDWWDMPGGGIDFSETPQEALARELREEMGFMALRIADHPTYSWTERVHNHRGLAWFYTLTLCYEAQVDSNTFKPSDECDHFDFFDKTALQPLLIWTASEKLKTVFHPHDLSFGSGRN